MDNKNNQTTLEPFDFNRTQHGEQTEDHAIDKAAFRDSRVLFGYCDFFFHLAQTVAAVMRQVCAPVCINPNRVVGKQKGTASAASVSEW